jgi:hypothetical protein
VNAHRALPDARLQLNSHACATDQDCTHVSLDLPCLHSCESVSVAKQDAAAVTAAFADVGRTYCDTAPASCPAHEVECIESDDADVCFQGTCNRVNLESSGCPDVCSCLAERSAAFTAFRGECAGPDLWVATSVACQSCGPGGVWLVIGNRGDTPFSGTAVLSFDPLSPDDATPVPAPRSLELTLAAGELTRAIYIEGSGEVETRPRITAPGDCQPSNDNSGDVVFPAAQSCP